MDLKTDYLELMGVERWALKEASVEVLPFELVGKSVNADSRWLVVLEKEEVEGDLSLLVSILGAVGETLDTVTLAYFDDCGDGEVLPVLPVVGFVMLMGESVWGRFLDFRRKFSDEVVVVTSDNLMYLANNAQAKRVLWEQLKPLRKS